MRSAASRRLAPLRSLSPVFGGPDVGMGEKRHLASWWAPPVRIATRMSGSDACDALQRLAQPPSLWQRMVGSRLFRRLRPSTSPGSFRIQSFAPLLSSQSVMLPVARGCVVPDAAGSVVEIEFLPRVRDVLLLAAIVVVPGLLEREAWFLGPVFALIWVALGAILVGGSEIDATAEAVRMAVEGVRLKEEDVAGRRTRG